MQTHSVVVRVSESLMLPSVLNVDQGRNRKRHLIRRSGTRQVKYNVMLSSISDQQAMGMVIDQRSTGM